MAEREGFEPSIRFPVYTRSRRAPSTTRPPLQPHAQGARRTSLRDGRRRRSVRLQSLGHLFSHMYRGTRGTWGLRSCGGLVEGPQSRRPCFQPSPQGRGRVSPVVSKMARGRERAAKASHPGEAAEYSGSALVGKPESPPCQQVAFLAPRRRYATGETPPQPLPGQPRLSRAGGR